MHPRAHTVAQRPSRSRRRRSGGQSVVEFAILLPLFLALLGLTVDFSRVFQAWITLESATRDAAEYAASSGVSSTDALSKARQTICLQAQNIPGFQKSGLTSPDDVNQCARPTVTVTSFSLSTTADGASNTYPVGSATVRATVPFSPLFAYPFITTNGTWTITTQSSFSVAQGRQ